MLGTHVLDTAHQEHGKDDERQVSQVIRRQQCESSSSGKVELLKWLT